MVDIISLLGGFFSIIWTSVTFTIPLLGITVVFLFVFNKVQKKYHAKWLGATLLTLFLCFFVLLAGLTLWNIWNGYANTDFSQIPTGVKNDPLYNGNTNDVLGIIFRGMIQSLLVGGIFTLVTLPFAFLGVAVFDVLKKRVTGVWARLTITCFLGAFLFIILLGAFPWLPVSLLYLAFFGL